MKVLQKFESQDKVISYTLEQADNGDYYLRKKGNEPELLTGTRADVWDRWSGLQMFFAHHYKPQTTK